MKDLPLRDAAALRSRIELAPIGGPGSTVFPPTYPKDANSKERIHVVETCRTSDGLQQRVLIDSVASQANRQEAALAAALRAGRICYPDLRVDLSQTEDPRDELLGTDLPHRLADAIVRDSEIDGVAFARSDYGRRILSATSDDLTPLLEASPLSLIFGVWFSQWQMCSASTFMSVVLPHDKMFPRGVLVASLNLLPSNDSNCIRDHNALGGRVR